MHIFLLWEANASNEIEFFHRGGRKVTVIKLLNHSPFFNERLLPHSFFSTFNLSLGNLTHAVGSDRLEISRVYHSKVQPEDVNI